MRGNASNLHKYLATAAINLHKCNVVEMLLSDGGDSQITANEN